MVTSICQFGKSRLCRQIKCTVEPVYYGHLGTNQKCPDYQGILIFRVSLYGCVDYRGVLIVKCPD